MTGQFIRASLICTAAWLATSPAVAQFKGRVDLVTVPISVTNRAGTERIRDLDAADFRIFDNGVEQPLSTFHSERLPLSICIVLDASGSIKGRPEWLAEKVVTRVIENLEPDDEISLIVFAVDAELRIPWTRSGSLPTIDWGRWVPEGRTAIADAVKAGMKQLDLASNRRSVLLIVSDGADNNSRASLHDIIRTRRQSETLIYAFELIDALLLDPHRIAQASRGAAVLSSRLNSVLENYVGDSGGILYPVQDERQAITQTDLFIDELRYQYLLGYVMPRVDGKFHQIKVELRKPGLTVRHRGAYIAIPSPPPKR